MKNEISSFLYGSLLHFLGILLVWGIFQAQVHGQIANAPCNLKSPWINGTYTNLAVTGTSGGICLGSAINEANMVDANLSNFASLSLTGLGCTGTFTVKDNDVADIYPAGTFAGFEVSATGLLSASIASRVTIFTYNNGGLVETYNAVTALVGVNTSLLNANGNAVLGFITTQPFDEIRIVYQPLVSVLFSAQIYGAVIKKYCAGTALACNVQTQMNNPTFPTSIDGSNTGITGLICAGCSVTNSENVISASTTDFATITLAVGVGSTGSLAVKDNLTSYAAGTFAGFNIANANLVNANLLSGITIRTYLGGVLKESSATGTLVSLNSALLNGAGEQLVGFVTTQAFDEVKLEVTNLIGVLNTTQVYNAVFQKFCAGPTLACSTNTYLVTPTYPVVIDGTLTGINGAACVGCSVSNTNNVVDASTTNFADIVLTVGILSSGSIAVKDVLTTYPIGTFAGFDIENSALIGLGLLNGASVSTYLNGVLQESSGGNLISLTLLSASRQIVGFTTTKTFNEVRFTASNLVGVNLGSTRVYGAVLKETSTTGVVAPVIPAPSTAVKNSCPSSSVNLNGLVTSSTPVGATLVWFTNNAHTGLVYPTPTTATAGVYYVFYYDSVKDCYSPASTPVTVTITVCANPDVTTAIAGVSSTILILANDKNADGTAVTDLTKITTPIITLAPTKGTATVNPDGSLKYTPSLGTSGTDTFIYSICDKINTLICDTALVTITITPAPQAIPDNAMAIVGVSTNIPVLTNDINPDGTPVTDLTKITSPIVSTAPSKGTATVNANGSIKYTANLGASGTDTFIYTICSIVNPAICDTALVTIKLNQKPVVTSDIAVTSANQSVTGNVLTNDSDLDGNTLTVSTTPTTAPTKGTLVLNANGTFTYTPNAGASGNDTFCYQVCDNGIPSACDTACISVQIVPAPILANNAPVASDDNTQTTVGISIIVNAKANDIDPDGFATLGTPTKLTDPINGVVTQLPNGNFTYTPNGGFIGMDTFTYSICDTGTPSKCDTATITVEVLPTPIGNQAPVALDDVVATISGSPVVIPVKNNDSDPDGNNLGSPTVITQPATGTVTVNGNGTLTFTPNNATFVGTATFRYAICDDGTPSKCDTASVSVVVLAPNKVCLTPKAYLQGALLGVDLPNTLMRDDLRVKNLIPTTSPYSGGLTVTNTTTLPVLAVTGANAIIDWVFVELRSGADSTLIVDSRSALIQRDGDIVDVDGTSSIIFSLANTGQYYLVVKHRNHLGVMSVKTSMSNICQIIDFQQVSTPNFNKDSSNITNQPQVIVQQGRAMWAGNTLDDTDIIYQGTQNDVNIIYQQVINAAGNFFVSASYKLKGYFAGDIDMNGEAIFQGTGNDVEFIYQNVVKNHLGNTLGLNYFKIKQQLP